MNKKIIKFLSIILIVVLLTSINNEAFATASTFSGATDLDDAGGSMIRQIISSILAVVRTVGLGIALIILMVIGSKYMLASAGERAEIKKYAVTYIVGAVVLFAASGLITIIQSFVETNVK